jgi:hypothetical protein
MFEFHKNEVTTLVNSTMQKLKSTRLNKKTPLRGMVLLIPYEVIRNVKVGLDYATPLSRKHSDNLDCPINIEDSGSDADDISY